MGDSLSGAYWLNLSGLQWQNGENTALPTIGNRVLESPLLQTNNVVESSRGQHLPPSGTDKGWAELQEMLPEKTGQVCTGLVREG